MDGLGPKLRLIVSARADGSDVGLIYYLCKVWLLGGTRRMIIKLAGSKVAGLMIVVSSVTIFGWGTREG